METLRQRLQRLEEEFKTERERIIEQLNSVRNRRGEYLRQIQNLRRKLDEADAQIEELQRGIAELERQMPGKRAKSIADYLLEASNLLLRPIVGMGDMERLARKREHLRALLEIAEDEEEKEAFSEQLRKVEERLRMAEQERGKLERLRLSIPFTFAEGVFWLVLPIKYERAEMAQQAGAEYPEDLAQALLYVVESFLHRFGKELSLNISEPDYIKLNKHDLIAVACEMEGADLEDVRELAPLVWEEITGEMRFLQPLSIRLYWIDNDTWQALEA